MDKHCGEHLSLSAEPGKSLSLKLTSAEEYGANMNCYVTVTGDVGSRMMTSFVWININSFLHCPGDFVQIMNTEDVNNHTHGTTPRSRCGSRDTPDAAMSMTSRGNSVTIRFVSDGEFFGEGFHIMLTQFHTGPSTDSEFSCDNGHCIHPDLSYDDDVFDHCGDFSDQCRLSVQVVVCVAIAVVVLVVVMMWVSVSVLVWHRVRRGNSRDEGDDELCSDDSWRTDTTGYVTIQPNPASIYILPSVADLLTSINITYTIPSTDRQTSRNTPATMTSGRRQLPAPPKRNAAAVDVQENDREHTR
ncbi:uncharacterized protein [Littorina saxatilis]|uniref:uncharacterized protein n=1 Tax=Littorina saxatilis TaxID=31220 RepID=UPI0038B5829D